uniref:Uncharacterized protein n=1 Tax=Oryza glumipatula TaxID=40148 RepID=A0A0E0BP00_9ORYZ
MKTVSVAVVRAFDLEVVGENGRRGSAATAPRFVPGLTTSISGGLPEITKTKYATARPAKRSLHRMKGMGTQACNTCKRFRYTSSVVHHSRVSSQTHATVRDLDGDARARESSDDDDDDDDGRVTLPSFHNDVTLSPSFSLSLSLSMAPSEEPSKEEEVDLDRRPPKRSTGGGGGQHPAAAGRGWGGARMWMEDAPTRDRPPRRSPPPPAPSP